LMQAANGNPDVALKLWIQVRLQQEFPISFQEVNNGTSVSLNGVTVSLPGKLIYQKAINGVSPDSAPPPVGRESSALLLLALSPQARRGQAVPIEESIGTASIQSVGGISAIVDGWGTPVLFTRDYLDDKGNDVGPAVISAGRDRSSPYPNPNNQNTDADD